MNPVAAAAPAERPVKQPSWQSGMLAVLGIAAASFVLHMILNNRYGYFRDEFNYIIGGKRFAVGLTALAVLIAPIYLSNASLLTSNCLEPLLWMGCIYFAILAVKRSPRYWLWFGVIAGIGMQEKYSIAVLGFGIVI